MASSISLFRRNLLDACYESCVYAPVDATLLARIPDYLKADLKNRSLATPVSVIYIGEIPAAESGKANILITSSLDSTRPIHGRGEEVGVRIRISSTDASGEQALKILQNYVGKKRYPMGPVTVGAQVLPAITVADIRQASAVVPAKGDKAGWFLHFVNLKLVF